MKELEIQALNSDRLTLSLRLGPPRTIFCLRHFENPTKLSEEELKYAFGSFTPVQSLNPYMTKLSLCSIAEAGL